MNRFQCVIAACITAMIAGCASRQTFIEQYGHMREVMREGKSQPRVALKDIAVDPGAVAVGALAGLNGEITIVNGGVWVARPDGIAVRITGPKAQPGDHATFLTIGRAANGWQSVSIDAPLSGTSLEAFIESAARAHGIDTSQPFPFIIEGELSGLSLHVINGYCPIAHNPATMDAQPYRYASDGHMPGVIAGIYARDAAGVLTHHGTSVHMHALFDDSQSDAGQTITGHVESVVINSGGVLRVPTIDVRVATQHGQ